MLKENDLAPDFELTADDGTQVRLSDLRGKKVVLFFYPRADTPGCTTEACEFRDLYPDIEVQGATVLGISPDTVGEVKKFRDKFGFLFRLLADAEHNVADLYGVWKEKSMFGKKYMGVERTTFVIDAEGRIERAYHKVSPKGHAGEVLKGL